MWISRISQPAFTSRVICVAEEKAESVKGM
jgi:hypothetical protein